MPNSISLEKVTPTKTFIIDSMPCEEKAAHIRNEAIQAIKQNNDMEMGYRYLQSRSGRISTSREAKLAGAYAIIMFVKFCSDPEFVSMFAMLFYIANIFPNISNSSRYEETETASADLLKKKFGEQEFKKIQDMPYNSNGLARLSIFFESKNITADEKKTKKIEVIQDSFLSFTIACFMPELTILMFGMQLLTILKKKLDSHLNLESVDNLSQTPRSPVCLRDHQEGQAAFWP
ncbi:hypothetical protein Lmor_0436 [Legionella moravica]|uniref:Uncharacterized protein n=1 Tax=Legionella moravica TaxID=39962 RepID=A0A378JT56_9GAMM|nr:hypothetical protein [Legionella moravica]KTD37573.1 hypothetical protein Lmor_0436 [Legionella moravica]STX61636.1 Uncharacterised protein [Legionella moravica]